MFSICGDENVLDNLRLPFYCTKDTLPKSVFPLLYHTITYIAYTCSNLLAIHIVPKQMSRFSKYSP